MIEATSIKEFIQNKISEEIQKDIYTDDPDIYSRGPYFHGHFDMMIPYRTAREYLTTKVELVGNYSGSGSPGPDPLSGIHKTGLLIPDQESLVESYQRSVRNLSDRDSWFTIFLKGLSGSSLETLNGTSIKISPIEFNQIAPSTSSWKSLEDPYNSCWLLISTLIATNLNALVGKSTSAVNGPYSGIYKITSVEEIN